MIRKFSRLAAGREDSLQDEKAALRKLHQTKEDIKKRSAKKYDENVQKLREIAAQAQ